MPKRLLLAFPLVVLLNSLSGCAGISPLFQGQAISGSLIFLALWGTIILIIAIIGRYRTHINKKESIC